MKRVLSVVLLLTVLLTLTGCSSLFSQADVVKLGDYSHKDPSGVSFDTRTVLSNSGFGATLAEYASGAAYPDTMVMDESGNVIGMYDYDATTGLAKGWVNISTGEYTAYEAGQEVDLGLPDASKMVSFAGDVTLYFVVYAKDNAPVESDMYLMLTSASDKDAVLSAMTSVFGMDFTAESDTVLKKVFDKAAVASEMELMGLTTDTDYVDYLKMSYSVRGEAGENPYKPYAEHKDPTDIEYDQKVVLTASGQAAVGEDEADCISSLSTFLYGKDGNIVAAYTYYESPTKEGADKLAQSTSGATRVSDTVLMVSYTGTELSSSIDQYIAFNLMKDHSLSEYTRLIEETFMAQVYE